MPPSPNITVHITLDGSCREQFPNIADTLVKTLIDENTNEGDAIVYTDGSVIRGKRSAWAFTESSKGKTIKEMNVAFAVTTSSLTMETMVVTRALAWLGTQKVPISIAPFHWLPR